MNDNYKGFEHTSCEMYPCHTARKLNCLFCYCPLYTLDCKGNFEMVNGKKDCSHCTLPHEEGGFEFIMKKLEELTNDFSKALKYLEECEKNYTEIGKAGVFALSMFIMPLRDRYNSGERSKALYDEIMEIA